MQLTGSQAVLESLLAEKVDTIFGYPGGAIMPVYDALYDYRKKLNHILVRHEQGAAHAAEGYAQVTGRAGVCLATSGPGATNLVTGISDAMMDSIPIVCITGQVAAHLVGTDAFQETDIIGITTPITKWNYQVTQAHEIAEVMAKAFYIARNGRPGPVLVDITKNAQIEMCEFEYPKDIKIESFQPTTIPNKRQIKLAAELINGAKRPYMFIGHGVLIAYATDIVKKVVEKTGIPVASTLLGLSALPVDHPQYVGMLGMHGNYGPNMLASKADVIVAVGMRFDDRVTGRLADFIPQARVIHIDIDPAELNKNVPAEVPIVADAKAALTELLPQLDKKTHDAWMAEFRKYNKLELDKVINPKKNAKTEKIGMTQAIDMISRKTKRDAIVVADVGQHQMEAARYYQFKNPHTFLTSGGAGTMGYALPTSMGAKVGAPDKLVVAIIGDGSFQMTLQELATIEQEKLDVKIFILNNNFLGMVRQWQQLFFDKRYSFVELKNPDFVALTKAFGIAAEKVTDLVGLDHAIDKSLAHKGPYLVEIDVAREENVFPMVATGKAAHEIVLE